MKNVIAQLEVSLHTLETNYPIYSAEGKTEQFDLAQKSAAETRQALAILKAVDQGPIWPEPSSD